MAANDAASWVAAVGTITAVVVALGLAIADGRRRSREERRRQAERITAWAAIEIDAGWVWVTLANASDQVAYRLVISVVSVMHGTKLPRLNTPTTWRRFISQLPPGVAKPLSVKWYAAGSDVGEALKIAFQDAAGRSWIRDWNGKLEAVKETDHLTRLGLEEP